MAGRGRFAVLFTPAGAGFAGLLAAGLGLGVLGLKVGHEGMQLAFGGVEAMAVVTRTWVTTDNCGEEGEDICSLQHAEYAYEVAGRRYTGSEVLPPEAFPDLREGGRFALRYAAGNPALRQIGGQSPLWGAAICLVFAVLMTGSGVLGLRHCARERFEAAGASGGS